MKSFAKSPWAALVVAALALAVNWPMIRPLIETSELAEAIDDALPVLEEPAVSEPVAGTFDPVRSDEVIESPFLTEAGPATSETRTLKLEVRMVVRTARGGVALIDDRLVRVGQRCPAGKLTEVRDDGVVIRSPDGSDEFYPLSTQPAERPDELAEDPTKTDEAISGSAPTDDAARISQTLGGNNK